MCDLFLRNISQKPKPATIYAHNGNIKIPDFDKRMQKGSISANTENKLVACIKFCMITEKCGVIRLDAQIIRKELIKWLKKLNTDFIRFQKVEKLIQYWDKLFGNSGTKNCNFHV